VILNKEAGRTLSHSPFKLHVHHFHYYSYLWRYEYI